MENKKPRLTWRKNKPERGVASILQGELGHKLYLDDAVLASVNAHSPRHTGITGWYWTCGLDKELGIERRNTSNDTPFQTAQEAKDAAKAYIETALKR